MSEGRKEIGWKTTIYSRGIIAGAIIGFLAAHFYARASEESNNGKRPNRISAADSLRIIVAILALIRQVTDLGSNKKDK